MAQPNLAGRRVTGRCFRTSSWSTNLTIRVNFNGANGKHPKVRLNAVDGTLYGTTVQGGKGNDGALFSYDPPSGRLITLASFKDSDGASPQAA